MLIKIRYPNHRHGYDLLLFIEFEKENSKTSAPNFQSCPDENPERLKVLDNSNFFMLQTVENDINLEENNFQENPEIMVRFCWSYTGAVYISLVVRFLCYMTTNICTNFKSLYKTLKDPYVVFSWLFSLAYILNRNILNLCKTHSPVMKKYRTVHSIIF